MTEKTCSIEDCNTSGRLTRGWCFKHYKRWQVHGDPLFVLQVKHEGSPEERFWAKVDKSSSELGCWLWTASISRNGYGLLGNARDGKTTPSHIFSYELAKGSVGKGMMLDHKFSHLGCPRHCVNPEHLREVTNKQNQENRVSFYASSGHRGVRWKASQNRWEAWVIHNKAYYYVGSYKPMELHVASYYARLRRNELYTHNIEDR